MSIPAEKRKLCADNALKCFGTAYIFECRARKIRRRVKLIAFLGIAAPASLGCTVALIGAKSQYVDTAILVAGLIAGLQLILSIWSLVSGWDNDLAYDIESKSDNYRLSDEFKNLGNTTVLSDDEFRTELKVLETHAEMRSILDNRVDITDKEKRKGMRAGLRNFQRACANPRCAVVPVSMKPTNCDVCGNF